MASETLIRATLVQLSGHGRPQGEVKGQAGPWPGEGQVAWCPPEGTRGLCTGWGGTQGSPGQLEGA